MGKEKDSQEQAIDTGQHDQTSRAWALVIVLIVIYIAVFTVFTIERYHRYNATGYDLGLFTQLTWNASRGYPMRGTVAEYDNFLALHATYIIVLLAPLFWVWADPRMLLIVQAVVLAGGAWPIARLSRRKLREPWAEPLFALLWLLYPALGWINRWDFHPIALTATFFAFAFEAADRRAWRQTDLWLLLALLSKEDVGLAVAFFGVYMVWVYGRRREVGATWFVIGVAWFVIHAFVIFPHNRGPGVNLPLHANRYEWLFDGTPHTWWEHITGPYLELRVLYLLKLFVPLAFVPLLAPRRLVPALPMIGLNLLSSHEMQLDIYMHYNATIIPAVLVGAIFGTVRLREWIARRAETRRGFPAAATLMLTGTLIGWVLYSPLGDPGEFSIFGWEHGAHVAALDEVRTLIPDDACVVTENNIQPQYSVREKTQVVGARGPGPVGDGDGCTYMIVDLGDRRHDDFTVGEQVACYQFWSGQRTPVYFRDTVVVLKWMPAEPDPAAWQQMDAYCAGRE
jgi:uncharacterized membrane protein